MPTTKTRVNITLSRPVEEALGRLARRDQIPEATKAAELLQNAIELEEDEIWDTVASRRDTQKAKFVSHKRAWA